MLLTPALSPCHLKASGFLKSVPFTEIVELPGMDKDDFKKQAGEKYLSGTDFRSIIMFLNSDRFLNRAEIEV